MERESARSRQRIACEGPTAGLFERLKGRSKMCLGGAGSSKRGGWRRELGAREMAHSNHRNHGLRAMGGH